MQEERIRFIDYKGKRILLEDFSNAKDENELIAMMWKAEEIIHKQQPKSLLVVVDMTNAHFGPNVSQSSKTAARSNTPYIKASAMVGMSRLMEIILQSLRLVTGRELVTF